MSKSLIELLPKADEKGKKGGWELDPYFLVEVKKELQGDIPLVGIEEIEMVLIAAGRALKAVTKREETLERVYSDNS